MLTWKYINLLLIMSMLAVAILWLTDQALIAMIKNYQPERSYWLAALVFLITSSALLGIALNLNWNKRVNYFLAAVAVFFPLVVLTEIIRILFEIDGSTSYLLSHQFCSTPATESLPCSTAFSYALFITSLRALPSIVVVPPVFYFLLVRLER